MKTKIIYIITAMLMLTSCNNWLEITPLSQVEQEVNFKSEDGFKRALTGCYSKLKERQLYGSGMTMTTVEYLAQHWYSESPAIIELKNFNYGNEDVKDKFKNIYSEMYNVIAQANDVLAHIQSNPDVIKNPESRRMIEAEALAIRAFCHFDIFRLFGQVPGDNTINVSLPYVETFSKENPSHYNYDQFVAKISADLLRAETLLKDIDPVFSYSFSVLNNPGTLQTPNLKDMYFAYRKFRFNYYAVKALQARFYLYIGQKTEAYDAANAVVGALDNEGKKYVSLAGANDFGVQNYALPSECIMALNSFNIDEIVSEYFRNEKTLYVKSETVSIDLFNGQKTHNRCSSLWFEYTDNTNGPKRMTLKKYWQDSEANNETDSDSEIHQRSVTKQIIPILRLSEMYLIMMETAPTLAEANALMKDYQIARYVTPVEYTQEQLNQEIIKEYRREFYAEGQMFFQYKRLNSTTMLWTNLQITPRHYIAPIPATEIVTKK